MSLTKEQSSLLEQLKDGMAIEDPFHLLTLVNEEIRAGRTQLYSWQIEILRRFSAERKDNGITRVALCASNGSGKTAYILAPCAVWLAMRFARGRSVVTTASGTQLDRQAARNITMLCQSVNKLFRDSFGLSFDVWKINYREFTYLPTGSIIECYATDEPGKAEGYHPLEGGKEFGIFVDEAKSIPEEIYHAIARCNGLSRRLDISSPGKPSGHFYDVLTGGRWFAKRVTYKDCTRHIHEDEVEEARILYGEHSPTFRSMYLAEFTSTDEQVVISYEYVKKLTDAVKSNQVTEFALTEPEISQPGIFAGIDLAAGGDENVISIFKGNRQIALISFRVSDTTVTADYIARILAEYNVLPENVNADDGGVGKAIIDMLWRRGLRINRVLNQARAHNTAAYANRGAELWFNFRRLVEEKLIILKNDTVQNKQLASRYFKQPESGKLQLESKADARARGHGSPDRADATVLAFAAKPFSVLYELMRGGGAKEATVNTRSFEQKIFTPAEILALTNNIREQRFTTQGRKQEGNITTLTRELCNA